MPAALSVDWDEVKSCSEGGMDDTEICDKFGVSRAAIRKRRSREKWLTPRKVQEEAAILATKKKFRSSTNASVTALVESDGVTRVTALEARADKLVRQGEYGSELSQDLAIKLLEFASNNPESLKVLGGIQDISTALNTVRKAAGLDKPSAMFQLNFGLGWKQPKSPDEVSEEA